MAGHTFPTRGTETAWRRDVLLAVEVIDAVTLERVTHGLQVRASGLAAAPIVNHGGLFVWLEPGGGTSAGTVTVEPGDLPYLRVDDVPAPAPPQRLLRIELMPRGDYVFDAGLTGIRASLRTSSPPPAPVVAGARVQLQWIDDDAPGNTWITTSPEATTDPAGDFAAFVRLGPDEVPRLDASTARLRARLRVRHAGTTFLSAETLLTVGRMTDAALPLALSDMQPQP